MFGRIKDAGFVFCGHDFRACLQKTLRLFYICNLALNEWLNSPVVYHQNDVFITELRSLVSDYFNPKKALFHYSSMAKSAGDNLKSDGSIGIKKLFYMLRPLLACKWIMEYRSMPPTAFAELLPEASSGIQGVIRDLLRKKETANEGEVLLVSDALQVWLRDTAEQVEAAAQQMPPGTKRSWAPLNAIMKNWVID